MIETEWTKRWRSCGPYQRPKMRQDAGLPVSFNLDCALRAGWMPPDYVAPEPEPEKEKPVEIVKNEPAPEPGRVKAAEKPKIDGKKVTCVCGAEFPATMSGRSALRIHMRDCPEANENE